MADDLLWQYNDLLPYLDHPDFYMRRWAADRLNDLYPDQAAKVLSSLLLDDDRFVRHEAIKAFEISKEVDHYGPILLDALREAPDTMFGPLARTAGELGLREAIPLIVDRFERSDISSTLRLALIQALEYLGNVKTAREILWQAAREGQAHSSWVSNWAFNALMRHVRADEIESLVALYRTQPYSHRLITSFATPVQATELAKAALRGASRNFAGMKAEITWSLGRDALPLSKKKTETLRYFFDSGQQGGLSFLHQEVKALFEEFDEDIDTWSVAWEKGEPLTGYPFTAAYIAKLVGVLATHPPMQEKRKHGEIALGLALLCRLWEEEDDQADIDNASNPMLMALMILSNPREYVMPGLVDQVASYGPSVLPILTPLLGPEKYGWETIRALQVIQKLAHDYPGSCDDIVPRIIDTMTDEQGDYIMEAGEKALRTIGVGALDAILEHIDDHDASRVIYLTAALENIPVERAADPFLAMIENGAPVDDLQFGTLVAIGSRRAIEPLYNLWQDDPEDSYLAECILVLCQLHDVHLPLMTQLREIVEKNNRSLHESLDDFIEDSGLFQLFVGETPESQSTAPPPDPEPKPFVKDQPKVGRNDPCPCGSGKKYKHCCGRRS